VDAGDDINQVDGGDVKQTDEKDANEVCH